SGWLRRRSPRGDGACGGRTHRGRQNRDRGRRVRRDLLSRVLRSPGVPGLKVRREIDVEVVALELYELEVTAPRDDFELEVRRTTQVARSPHAASFDAARKLYRKFGSDPSRTRPASEAQRRPGQTD